MSEHLPVPEGWETAEIESCLSLSAPGEWGSPPTGGEDDVLVVRSTNFTDKGRLDLTRTAFRSVRATTRDRLTLRGGDILLEKSGGSPSQPVGRVVYFDASVRCICANFIQLLRPNDDVNPKFLFYELFHGYESGLVLRYQQQTTGIINLRLAEYLDEEIPLPPLPEQRKIAAILGSVDAAIETTEALIAKLKDLKTAMMQELLTRGLPPAVAARHGIRKSGRLKDSPVGRIPEEWEVVRLGECIEGTPAYGANAAAVPFNPSYPRYVRITDVDEDGDLRSETAASIPPQLAEGSLLQAGDVLFARSGATVGKTYLHRHDHVTAAFAGYMIRATPDPTRLIPGFLFQYTHSMHYSTWVVNTIRAGAQPNINGQEYASLPIPLPSITEQLRITKILDGVVVRIASRTRALSRLQFLKKALMQDLLTGRVRVKV